MAYHVYSCWPSEYQGIGDLDANAGAVVFGHLKLENEGWLRDDSVAEPAPPAFTTPTG